MGKYISDVDYLFLQPFNNSFVKWMHDLVTTNHVLIDFPEHLPELYFNIIDRENKKVFLPIDTVERKYGENIRELTREKETLAAKMRIHDEFGQALLAAHRLTARPSEPEQRAEVLRLWRQNLTLMERLGEEKPSSQGFAALIASASAIGVRLTVDGALPPEGTACASLLESAARECLTNAARHAGSAELILRLLRGSGRLRAVFTNYGRPP